MTGIRLATCLPLLAIMLASCSTPPKQAESAAPARPAGAARTPPAPRPPNYVDAADFDYLTLLPPAPQKGSARDRADREMFRKTRRFKDTPRWAMASRDADARPADFLDHFSCALDLQLTPESAPQIAKLAQNVSSDAGRLTSASKNHYKRQRPYHIDKGPTCRPASETGTSFDYPSGHTIAGWAWASALAQVVPERSSLILARGRAYGESRIICGVHNISAVEAGRLAATAVASLAQASEKYQADLAAARAEYASLRNTGPRPEPARCANEKTLIALPLD